ncbi:MAG: hypothetical protein ACXVCY_04500 [Pseudobdellovibrionaceae bacterium]
MMTQVVVYKNAKNESKKFVAREWIVKVGTISPGNKVCESDQYGDIEKYIQDNYPNHIKLMPNVGDDPVIQETWI